MDKGLFPEMSIDKKLVERVMNDIFSPEFDESSKHKGLGDIWFRFRRWRANIWKHRLVYNQPLIPMFLHLAWSHVKKPKCA